MIINNTNFKQCPINDTYFVSKDGQVFSSFKNDFLSWSLDKDGYPRIDLYVNGKQKHFKIHRLVWITWNGAIPDGMQVNHKDDNKLNPSLDNLYLGNQKENIQDCFNNNSRVGYVFSLSVYDKVKGKAVTFCPAYKFIEYSGHTCANGSISRMMKTNWFKTRYKILYYKQVENVTTMADECKPVE